MSAYAGRAGGGLTPARALMLRAEALNRRDWVWLIALWAIVTGSNLFRPYHIDDTAHLEIAQWIAAHPLHPMTGLVNWNRVEEPIFKTSRISSFICSRSGDLGLGVRVQRTRYARLQSLATLACILLFHRMARALAGPVAIWATSMLILGPAFLVEQNLMVDVPLLAACLVFFNVLICDVHNPRQARRYLVAALACAVALLIKGAPERSR